MSKCIKDLYDYNLIKKCLKCGIVKLRINFHKNNKSIDGFQPYCISCRVQYYDENRDKTRNYYLENRDRIKNYYLENRDQLIKSQKLYKKIKRYRCEYYKKRREKDLIFKLACNLRSRTNKAFKSQNVRKTKKTFDLLGCSHSFLRQWIIHQLYGNMTFENYGCVWQIDHCLPIASFSLLDENDMKKCFNWINLRPMYSNSKNDKIDNRLYLMQEVKAHYFMKLNDQMDLTKIFVDEIYSKLPRKNYPTNKIIYNNIDEIWSIDLADMIDYKISNSKGYSHIFIVIDNFAKYFRAIPLKNKYSQTITNEFSNILTTSKRQPLKIESDRGTEFYNSIFQKFFKIKNIQHYSRFTDKGPSIAERVIRTMRNLLKKPLFEKGNADWLSELPSVVKKYNNALHHSIKMTPIQASKKVNEKEVYSNLKDKREVQKPKFKLGQLVRTADIKRVFSRGDSTNWS